MNTIKFTDKKGNLIAEGVLGESIIEVEGNYYVNRDKVNLEGLAKKENAYHCPIKKSPADYYYVTNEKGEPQGQEACWIYEEVENPLFKNIAGMVGFYSRSTESIDIDTT